MLVVRTSFQEAVNSYLQILKTIKSRRIYSWEKETKEQKEGKSGEGPTVRPGLNSPKRIKKRKLRNRSSKPFEPLPQNDGYPTTVILRRP
jgi:hypothetical protein